MRSFKSSFNALKCVSNGLAAAPPALLTSEISIHAQEVTLLSKSLQILPEKYHGLTDTDARYRQRYVDLIMNAEVKDTFIKRSKVLSSVLATDYSVPSYFPPFCTLFWHLTPLKYGGSL